MQYVKYDRINKKPVPRKKYEETYNLYKSLYTSYDNELKNCIEKFNKLEEKFINEYKGFFSFLICSNTETKMKIMKNKCNYWKTKRDQIRTIRDVYPNFNKPV